MAANEMREQPESLIGARSTALRDCYAMRESHDGSVAPNRGEEACSKRKKLPFAGGAGTYEGRCGEGQTPHGLTSL